MSLVSVLHRFSKVADIIYKQTYFILSRHTFKQKEINKEPVCFPKIFKRSLLTKTFIRNYCIIEENAGKFVDNEIVFRIFTNFGFSEDDITNLLKKCSDIIKFSEEDLINNLNCWMECQFGEDNLILLLLKYPNLILIPTFQVKNVYLYLLSIYKKNEIYKIFLNSPHIIMDNVDIIQEKLSYLQDEMIVSKTQIINSSALGYPLRHIKERHEFLRRVGIYKIPDKKQIGFVNPRLDIIVSSSDEDFATKVAGVTLLEYEVFQLLFLKEQEDE